MQQPLAIVIISGLCMKLPLVLIVMPALLVHVRVGKSGRSHGSINIMSERTAMRFCGRATSVLRSMRDGGSSV